MVRNCFDQLKHLLENCNLEIKVPRIATPQDADKTIEPQIEVDKTLHYYLLMNISKFKKGQVDAMECIEKALTRRFSAMDRMLNLENFQGIEGKLLDMFNINRKLIKVNISFFAF